ncbi:hypothetical protein [Bifidobacterium miconisargentati]|uniref:hypothetical protein n=1 Tax=Bifidobacterium miconisargentati TaxID=2834437 RepID=UPI001F31C2CC|nr:hypothetical protein [Bifidobacterium miconisargentati]
MLEFDKPTPGYAKLFGHFGLADALPLSFVLEQLRVATASHHQHVKNISHAVCGAQYIALLM